MQPLLPASWAPETFVPLRRDALLTGVMLVVSQVEVWWYGAGGGGAFAAATLGLAAVAMLWRSRHPGVSALLVAAALFLCAQLAGEPFSATSVVTFLVAFFGVGAMPNRRLAIAALVVAVAVSPLTVEPLTLNTWLAVALSSLGMPWLLGTLWRHHLTRTDEVAQRALAAEAAVVAERRRLARELHDVVSHNVGMIAVQAGAADVLLEEDPARSRESLHAIEEGARVTLLELRRMLGLLHEEDPEPLRRSSSIADLDQMVHPLGAAGVSVALQTEGEPCALDREVEVTAYRVVQEALTNVVAHAAPCHVLVALRYLTGSLDVEIADDGTAATGTSRGGYGLTGLRERVRAVGGVFEAGPRTEGGFRVRAVLPVAGG
ncbi:MAG TPA: histidine kinase [Marmoricola sp.]|nr:histidine kinase [Marmoricola sp.]